MPLNFVPLRFRLSFIASLNESMFDYCFYSWNKKGEGDIIKGLPMLEQLHQKSIGLQVCYIPHILIPNYLCF